MGGSFSETVLKRLPSVIQALGPVEQKVYIYLRLRKDEENIARILALPVEDVKQKALHVRDALMRSGQIDLIQAPVVLSIHSDSPGAAVRHLTSKNISMDNTLILNEFLTHLKSAIDQLPKDQARLLRLRYNHRMTAGAILGFCKKLGFSLVHGKDIADLKEQDVFYSLNVALREVLKGLGEHYGDGDLCPEGLKYVFEEIEI